MKLFKLLSYIKNSDIDKTSKIWPFSRISNLSLGAFSYLGYNAMIHNAEIGNFCSIGSGVKIGLGKHPAKFISSSPLFYANKNPLGIQVSEKNTFIEHEKVYIGSDVWMGVNVVILDGITVGDGAIIGANSVVNKDIEPYSIVGGVPAKLIRKRFDSELQKLLVESKWWQLPISFFKKPNIIKLFSEEINLNSAKDLLNEIKKSEG